MGRKPKTIDVATLVDTKGEQISQSPDTEEYFANTGQKKASGIHSPLVRQLSKLEAPDVDDIELIKRVRNGDQSGNFLLLCKHYKYILAKVIEATNGTWFSEDIFQAGIVGLYEAVKHYDLNRNNKFLTYAHYWILKFIYIEIRDELLPLGGIGIGRDTKERLYNYIKYKMQGLTDEELMEKLHVKQHQLDEIKILNSVAARVKSLNDTQEYKRGSGASDSGVSSDSMVRSDSSVDDIVATNVFMEYLEEKVNELSKDNPELALFMCYEFGFSRFEQLDKGEVCTRMQINSKRYDQLHKEGSQYLKGKMSEDNWYEDSKKEETTTVWEKEPDVPPVVKKKLQEKASLEEA